MDEEEKRARREKFCKRVVCGGKGPFFRRPLIAIAIRERRKNGGRSHVACTVWRKVVSIRIFDMNRMCRVHICMYRAVLHVI